MVNLCTNSHYVYKKISKNIFDLKWLKRLRFDENKVNKKLLIKIK